MQALKDYFQRDHASDETETSVKIGVGAVITFGFSMAVLFASGALEADKQSNEELSNPESHYMQKIKTLSIVNQSINQQIVSLGLSKNQWSYVTIKEACDKSRETSIYTNNGGCALFKTSERDDDTWYAGIKTSNDMLFKVECMMFQDYRVTSEVLVTCILDMYIED